MAENDIIVPKEAADGGFAEIALAPADIGAVANTASDSGQVPVSDGEGGVDWLYFGQVAQQTVLPSDIGAAEASHTHDAAAITSGTLDNDRINFAAPPAIGNTTPAAGSFTTLVANNGTLTASAPALDVAQTWNASGTTFTGLRVNVTETAAAVGSRLFDFQVGGATQLRLQKLTQGYGLFGGANNNGIKFGSAFVTITTFIGDICNFGSNSAVTTRSDHAIGFSSTGNPNLAPDTALRRDDAGVFAQYNGTNAQEFRIYNTFTSATNHERGFLRWSSNVFQIGTEKGSAGGTARALEFQTDGVTRLTLGATSNIVSSALGFSVPNNGEYRFGGPACRLVGTSSGSQFISLQTSSIDRLVINNTLVGFGGTTSSFPSLKRDTTTLQARLADDSDFTAIQGKLTTETAYTAGAPTATGYLVVYDSNGTAYKVPAEAL